MFKEVRPDKDELTPEEREELGRRLHSLITSDGWAWFTQHVQRVIEARRRSIEDAPLDGNLPLRIAQDRGAAQALRQMLAFPRTTLASLTGEGERHEEDEEEE